MTVKISRIKTYSPLYELQEIAKDIWIVDGPIIRMALYGFKVPFTTRMTIVRLANGDLWCHSPIELTGKMQEQIDKLGPVKHLISPNKIHYAYIDHWKKAYPKSLAWASPGVRDRAEKQKIEVNFDRDLDNNAPPEWSEIWSRLFLGAVDLWRKWFFS